jgi:hypothetical protein
VNQGEDMVRALLESQRDSLLALANITAAVRMRGWAWEADRLRTKAQLLEQRFNLRKDENDDN